MTDDGPTVYAQGWWDPLSNFYNCNFYYEGVYYRSVEHAYQYQKAVAFDQGDLLPQILKAHNASHAKTLCSKLQSKEWDGYKGKLMYQLLVQKFKQIPNFRHKLLLCAGSKIIHNVSDHFWGWGRDQKSGKNLFGCLLSNVLTQMTSSPNRPQPNHKSSRHSSSTTTSSSSTTATTSATSSFQSVSKSKHTSKSPNPKSPTTIPTSNRFSPISIPHSSPLTTSHSPTKSPPHPNSPTKSSKSPSPKSPSPPPKLPTYNSVYSSPNLPPSSNIPNSPKTPNSTTPSHSPIPFTLSRSSSSPHYSPNNSSSISSQNSSPQNIKKSFKIKPTRHQKTSQKLLHWKFPKVSAPTLVIGTSNLANISESPSIDIQIESFPGCQIRHLDLLTRNYKHNSKPETIILDIGINDGDNSFTSTTRPNLKKMISAFRNTFPDTKLCIPQIQFSNKLPKRKQENLKKFNEDLYNCHYINTLPPLCKGFQIADDDVYNVHWTNSTANALLKHWIHHLNY